MTKAHLCRCAGWRRADEPSRCSYWWSCCSQDAGSFLAFYVRFYVNLFQYIVYLVFLYICLFLFYVVCLFVCFCLPLHIYVRLVLSRLFCLPKLHNVKNIEQPKFDQQNMKKKCEKPSAQSVGPIFC